VTVLKNDYDGQDCSVARALELVGERWTLLVVRDAFLGRRRFEEFQESLGIARNVLADRLQKLVEHGIFERVRYQERPERFEYRLTRKGRDLRLVLTALMQWGDRYVSATPPRLLRRVSDGAPVHVALVDAGGTPVDLADVENVAAGRRRSRRQPSR
jgi:DNA-binding HxlR family transcriptional regulator